MASFVISDAWRHTPPPGSIHTPFGFNGSVGNFLKVPIAWFPASVDSESGGEDSEREAEGKKEKSFYLITYIEKWRNKKCCKRTTYNIQRVENGKWKWRKCEHIIKTIIFHLNIFISCCHVSWKFLLNYIFFYLEFFHFPIFPFSIPKAKREYRDDYHLNSPCIFVKELCLMNCMRRKMMVAPNRNTMMAMIEPRSMMNHVCVSMSCE